MLLKMMKDVQIALALVFFFTLLTGLIYPGVVTGFAQLLFPYTANGSLIQLNDKIVGSLLLGQAVTDPRYFWGRPSATTPTPYNAAHSSGSNWGPSNPEFLLAVKARVAQFHQSDPTQKDLIPIELVTASGSGLDPEISLRAAYYQVPRIARARNIAEKQVEWLIQQALIKRSWGILGEERVNVGVLNRMLDQLGTQHV